MSLVIAGTVAPMKRGDERSSFKGRVWIGDDGRIAAVTKTGQRAPRGFDTAPVVDVGSSVVYPGFIDLHSHLAYNTLPLWEQPTEEAPYAHRGIWPSRPTYKPDVAWPAWTLMELAPESMYAYAQVRALAGGTTAIQGWPSASRPPLNRLVRSIDDDNPGTRDDDPIRVAVETKDKTELRDEAGLIKAGGTFVYHLAEGQPDSIAANEFSTLTSGGRTCLHDGFVAIHGNALSPPDFAIWRQKAKPTRTMPSGTIVWSPFSNLWLYGMTTLVPDAKAAKVRIALGCDWGPSGTKNLLGEIKVARLWSDHEKWDLSDHDLVSMLTVNPGDVLARAWGVQAGRLQRGALGDVTVLARSGRRDVWRNVVQARDEDVELVVIDGEARFGAPDLIRAAGARNTTAVQIGAESRRATLSRPDDQARTWAWSDVIKRLNRARTFAKTTPPRGPSAGRGPVAPRAARPSFDPEGTPQIAVRLDMPGGMAVTGGPPPKGKTVDVPPIEPLHHNARWLRSIKDRGFHGGVLDGLASFYR